MIVPLDSGFLDTPGDDLGVVPAGEAVIVATADLSHLSRFVAAELGSNIHPASQ